jgi:hypothetical protein
MDVLLVLSVAIVQVVPIHVFVKITVVGKNARFMNHQKVV